MCAAAVLTYEIENTARSNDNIPKPQAKPMEPFFSPFQWWRFFFLLYSSASVLSSVNKEMVSHSAFSQLECCHFYSFTADRHFLFSRPHHQPFLNRYCKATGLEAWRRKSRRLQIGRLPLRENEVGEHKIAKRKARTVRVIRIGRREKGHQPT